jgi:D-methionine transport system substrate-binding protein
MKTTLLSAALAALIGLAAAPASAQSIKVGVTPGPHAQIFEAVKPIAKRAGLDIQIVEFSDYVIPNTALAQGEIDANSFQHQPYLDNQAKDRGLKIESITKTVVFPMGFYSKKVKSIDELQPGANVGIQNDPTNGARALLLLQEKGLIKLKDGVGLKATVLDVADNPKKLKLVELDAAQLPRSLDDLALAAVNTNYAVPAGLNPNKDALIRESPNSPYMNIIAVQSSRKAEPWVAKLVAAYRSPEVKDFIEKEFKGVVVTDW